MMKAMNIAACVLLLGSGCAWIGDGDEIAAVSPDGRNKIRLYLNPMAYEVLRDGKVVVAKSSISLRIEGRRLSREAEEEEPVVSTGRVMGKFFPKVYKKGKVFESGYETNVDFGRWGVRLMARDDGVAYRFETRFPEKIRVNGERAGFAIPDESAKCWVHFTGRFGWEETKCQSIPAKEVKTDSSNRRMIYPPFVYRVGGTTVAVLESDVCDYPMRYFDETDSAAGAVAFKSVFAGWPKREHHSDGSGKVLERGGRRVKVDKHAEWLVETDGTRTFPWRAFALADRSIQLVESDIVYALARPAATNDFSWVKPGKVAWDWWNAFDNKGTEKGCTTETYLRFVDFAADNGVEYVIMDEGWSEKLDIWKFSPRVDVPKVIEHANKRGVGIILWMSSAQVIGDEDHVAEHFAKLGAKGFKVDFMDRSDAKIERFLWKFAESCRRNRMVVDYHGSHCPTGLHRTYPNVINSEGVYGLEQMKWNNGDPEILANDVRLCYTRMTAGPMDYTPGAMDNYAIGKYPQRDPNAPRGKKHYAYINPGSLGTRCRQMAMIALYDAPLQMLCDSPTKYERNMECFSFMAATPTVWDETLGLQGTPDTCAVVARRKGDVWYVAGITDAKSRYCTLDTSFLPEGDWNMEIFRDAHDSDENGTSYSHIRLGLHSGESIVVRLASGGGFIARCTK